MDHRTFISELKRGANFSTHEGREQDLQAEQNGLLEGNQPCHRGEMYRLVRGDLLGRVVSSPIWILLKNSLPNKRGTIESVMLREEMTRRIHPLMHAFSKRFGQRLAKDKFLGKLP